MLGARCLHSRETVFMLDRRLKLIFSHIVPLKCLNTVKRLLMCVYVTACVTCLKLLSAKDRITWRLKVGKTPNCPNLPDFFEMDGGFNSHLTLQTRVCRCKQSRGVRQISKSEKAADRVNVEWAKKQDCFYVGKVLGITALGFSQILLWITQWRAFFWRGWRKYWRQFRGLEPWTKKDKQLHKTRSPTPTQTPPSMYRTGHGSKSRGNLGCINRIW